MISLHLTKQTVLTPLCLLTGLAITCSIPLTPPAIAQIVPDNSLGSESSVIVPNQNIRGINSNAPEGSATLRIDGGAVPGGNLFHSFEEFIVDE